MIDRSDEKLSSLFLSKFAVIGSTRVNHIYYAPAIVGEGYYKMGHGVCLSVCGVPRPNSRTERPRGSTNWQDGSTSYRHTGNPWTYLEVKKVTRPINAVTESVSYLTKGKAFEVQTWYTDGSRRLVSQTTPWPLRSNVRSQGHVVRLTGVGL